MEYLPKMYSKYASKLYLTLREQKSLLRIGNVVKTFLVTKILKKTNKKTE